MQIKDHALTKWTAYVTLAKAVLKDNSFLINIITY